MIKIVKNDGKVMRSKNGNSCPKYLLKTIGKDGDTYYAKIGVGEIMYYIRAKIKGEF